MWFADAGEVVEMFKNSFPLSLMFFVPIFILMSPVSPVLGSHEFSVFRMQHYDLQGSTYGCKNALINVEARPVDAKVYTRRCIISKLHEINIGKYKEMVSQNAGALLILLPKHMGALSNEDREQLMELEQDLLQEEILVPIFFAVESDNVDEIYSEVKIAVNSDLAGTATEALMSSAFANGFQLVIAGTQAKALNDYQVVNIQGKLAGYGIEEQLPTVAVVAHYDAFGIAPSLSTGADSNGSGVVVLLELARLFSKLYTNSRTHAKFNLLFLLSGAGKFNYQGSKKWIEDQLEGEESGLLSDVSYVMCLDAVGSGDELFFHVSKPPKETSPANVFFNHLQQSASEFGEGATVKLNHKKINLGEDLLAWEHERFSIRRLPGFTLSHIENHKDLIRKSVLDTRENVDTGVLTRNVKVVAEALARQVFNLSSDGNLEVFSDGLRVEEGPIVAWLEYLTSLPRSAQLLSKDSQIVASLEQAMSKYLKDVKKLTFKAEKRDPDFVFYSGAEYTMNAHNVKPAVFDLFLAIAIAAYLGLIFLFVQNFGTMLAFFKMLAGTNKSKKQ